MLRSLHMKLVMILVLLILSLMMVVGAFLINSVTAFYLKDFYSQMADVFQDPILYHDLTTPSGEEENGAEQLSLEQLFHLKHTHVFLSRGDRCGGPLSCHLPLLLSDGPFAFMLAQ